MHEILLVEDNPDTVEFLQRRLREAGYGVRVARNGLEALRSVALDTPAVVILDINLPLINGDDVCRQLRGNKQTEHLPIIFMTAEPSERVKDLLATPGTLCLEKAIKTKSLLEALDRLLSPIEENSLT